MHESREPRPSTRPRSLAVALLLAISVGLSACGGGKGGGKDPKTPPAPPELTPQEKITQLEARSGLPVLDRTPMLGGIDSNGDGVREDIAEYIEHKYTDPVQRRAAMQMARAYRAMLLVDTGDAVALQLVSEQGFAAIVCIRHAFPGQEHQAMRFQVAETLRDMTTNTKERLQAYLAYNKARSGSVSIRPEGNTCE